MKKVILLIGLLALCFGVGKGFHMARKGFSLRHIHGIAQMQATVWNPEAEKIIEQPFVYLGRGRQCYAFVSSDGNYILKLPRMDHYQLPFWMRALPLSSKQAARSIRSERERWILDSFLIASKELREQTGVLALHFGEMKRQEKWITVIDPLGCKFHLPFHKTTFLLQQRQPILMRGFVEALSQGDRAKAERILSAFIDIVVERGKKGIWNRDESFMKNYGFDGEKAFLIDVGSLYRKPDGIASIHDTMHPIRSWLRKTDVSMLNYFDEVLEKKLAN